MQNPDPAVFESDGHECDIGVIRLRLHVLPAHGRNRFGLAHDKTHKIDFMGVHFHQRAPALGPRLAPCRRPPAAPTAAQAMHGQTNRRAQSAPACQIAHLAMHRMEATHQPNAQRDPARLTRGDHLIAPREGGGHGLFAKHVHARLSCCQCGIDVQKRRRGDQRGLHIFAYEHRSVIGLVIAPHFLGQCAPFFAIHIASANHLSTIQISRALCQTRAHVAASNDAQSEFCHVVLSVVGGESQKPIPSPKRSAVRKTNGFAARDPWDTYHICQKKSIPFQSRSKIALQFSKSEIP